MIRVGDPADGGLTGTIRDDAEPLGLALSPEGDVLASYTDDDGRVSLWDTSHLTPVAGDKLQQRYRPESIAFGPDGELAWGGGAGDVWWWDPASNEAPAGPLTGHRLSRAFAVAFSPDGNVLAAGGEATEGALVLWEADTGRPLGPPLVPGGSVAAVAFSPDGTSLAASGRDGAIWIWDRATGERVGDSVGQHGSSVTSLAFSPDSRLLASSDEDGNLRLWETRTADPVGGPLPGASKVTSIAFASRGRLLATASEDGTVRLWDLNVDEACRIARVYVTAAQVRPHLPPGRQPTCGYVD